MPHTIHYKDKTDDQINYSNVLKLRNKFEKNKQQCFSMQLNPSDPPDFSKSKIRTVFIQSMNKLDNLNSIRTKQNFYTIETETGKQLTIGQYQEVYTNQGVKSLNDLFHSLPNNVNKKMESSSIQKDNSCVLIHYDPLKEQESKESIVSCTFESNIRYSDQTIEMLDLLPVGGGRNLLILISGFFIRDIDDD